MKTWLTQLQLFSTATWNQRRNRVLWRDSEQCLTGAGLSFGTGRWSTHRRTKHSDSYKSLFGWIISVDSTVYNIEIVINYCFFRRSNGDPWRHGEPRWRRNCEKHSVFFRWLQWLPSAIDAGGEQHATVLHMYVNANFCGLLSLKCSRPKCALSCALNCSRILGMHLLSPPLTFLLR